jgi:hypothetical protein
MSESEFKPARFVVNCEVWIRDCKPKKKKDESSVGFKSNQNDGVNHRARTSFHLCEVVTFVEQWPGDWEEPDVPETKVFFMNGNSLTYILNGDELQRRFNEYHLQDEAKETLKTLLKDEIIKCTTECHTD